MLVRIALGYTADAEKAELNHCGQEEDPVRGYENLLENPKKPDPFLQISLQIAKESP